MLLVRNQIGARTLGGTAMVLAALFAFSNMSARGQNPGIYDGGTPEITSPATVPATTIPATTTPYETPTTALPTVPATGTNWHSYGIEQLLEGIGRLQRERNTLEKQQKEIEAVLLQKMRLQQEQIRKLGIIDVEKINSTPSSVKPK